MKEKFLNATIATMLVITLTMANFIILGVNVVTYASELLHQTSETNYKNVEFTTYFKTETGDKIDMAQTPINTEGLKLYMQVAVKEEGYFQGAIEISNNNFALDTKKTSNVINKIDGNWITLNQINAGQTVEVEVGINPIKDNSIDQGLLSAITNVSLKGTYVSNKERQTPIDSTKNVQLILLNPYTDEQNAMKLSSEVITNKLYEVEEKDSETNNTVKVNKRMVQVKVRSGLKGNQYPIKNTNLKFAVPEGVEKVEVSSQGTKATNGRTSLSWEQVDNTLDVKIENTPSEEGKIAWSKSGEDVIVVTYILPENVNVTKTNIDVADEIQLYDTKETKLTGNVSATILEEKDGTVEFEETSSETSIYKGKIYTKEDREIKTNTNIYINYEEQTEKINVQEKIAKYTGANELNANVQYKMTSINKDQFIKLFGENGYIIISDENKNTIASVTNDVQADENGNVVINYPENVKVLNIETSKPIAKGRINLKHIKTIKNDGYSRDIIRSVNALKQEIVATYNKENKTAETNVELKETDTTANLSIDNNTISTQRQTNIEMRATLKANKENNDLFKNPTVRIQLPQEVTNVEVSNISLLYEDELKIANARYDKASKTIVVDLQGEQTKYHTDVNEGAQIYIVAKVSADELTPSRKSEITFTYSNENSISGQKSSKLPVKIESKYGLMLYTKALNYNNSGESVKTIDSQVPVAKLDVNSHAKIATMNMAVLNNYGTALTNIAIVGRIPNKAVSEGTLDTTLAQPIKTNIEGAKVYYSAEASANAQDNVWTDNAQNLNAVKSYKIVLDTMQPETALKFAYTFAIPEKLDYNQVVNSKFDVNYTYVEQQMNASSGVQFKTQEKKLVQYIENDAKQRTKAQTVRETVTEQGLKVETKITKSGGKDKITLTEGNSVYEGDTLHYTVKVSNNTGADINNVKATVTQTNAVFYEKITRQEENAVDPNSTLDSTNYEETDNKEKVFSIDTLTNGQSKSFEYEVVVNLVEGEDKTTQGTIKLSSDNTQEQTMKTFENKIIQGKLKLNLKVTSDLEKLYTTAGSHLPMTLSVENISSEDINGAILEIPMENSNLTVNQDEIFDMDNDIDNGGFIEVEETEGESSESESIQVISTENNILKLKINDTLKVNSSKKININFITKEFTDKDQEFNLYFLSNVNDELYTSNEFSIIYTKHDTSLDETVKAIQTSNPSNGSTLEDGDIATYTIDIENKFKDNNAPTISIDIPNSMEIQRIVLVTNNKEEDVTEQYVVKHKEDIIGNGNEDDEDEDNEEYSEIEDDEEEIEENKSDQKFDMIVNIPGNSNAQIKIDTKLNVDFANDNEKLENKVVLKDQIAMESKDVNSITYYAKVEREIISNSGGNTNIQPGGPSNNQQMQNNNNKLDNQKSNNKYSVSGLVWLDKDKNGKKDDASVELENIIVKAIDTKGEFVKNTLGKEIVSQVSTTGKYKIDLPEGNYMLVFIYDTGKYELTTYSNSSDGSSAIDKTLNLDGNNTKVAVTNTLTVNKDISNVNVGLIEKENFSLGLQKYINKVTVQNKGGTKTTQYNNSKLAKTEVRAKYFSGTTLLVEYKIDVTNNGGVDGYVNDIVDYIPNGYKFSSDLNNTWYESTDKNLHNNSLSNEKIKVGETKSITLVLTKVLTENDTGLVVNTAEIANSASVSGSADVNSTVNNKAIEEDDISSANLLVSVSTGLKTACIIGILISFILVGLCVYMIKRGEG